MTKCSTKSLAGCSSAARTDGASVVKRMAIGFTVLGQIWPMTAAGKGIGLSRTFVLKCLPIRSFFRKKTRPVIRSAVCRRNWKRSWKRSNACRKAGGENWKGGNGNCCIDRLPAMLDELDPADLPVGPFSDHLR